MKKFEKVMMIVCVVIGLLLAYDNFFGYTYVTKEDCWHKNEYLWNVAERNVGPHEDIGEVLFRIQKDNPGAKPGCILKVKIKTRR